MPTKKRHTRQERRLARREYRKKNPRSYRRVHKKHHRRMKKKYEEAGLPWYIPPLEPP